MIDIRKHLRKYWIIYLILVLFAIGIPIIVGISAIILYILIVKYRSPVVKEESGDAVFTDKDFKDTEHDKIDNDKLRENRVIKANEYIDKLEQRGYYRINKFGSNKNPTDNQIEYLKYLVEHLSNYTDSVEKIMKSGFVDITEKQKLINIVATNDEFKIEALKKKLDYMNDILIKIYRKYLEYIETHPENSPILTGSILDRVKKINELYPKNL